MMHKRLLILPALLALTFALALGLSHSVRTVSASDIDASVDLIFLSGPTSCYCDGMHLVYDLNQGYSITGNRTGCATEPFIFGTFLGGGNPIPPSGSTGAAVAFNIGSNILTKLRFATKEWAHYYLPYTPGDPPLNSGNYEWGATCPYAPVEGAGSSVN